MIALSDGFRIFETLSSGGGIAPSLLCVAAWEMFWPEHKNASPFLRRWANNFTLFAISLGVAAILAPRLALVTGAVLERSPLHWAPGEVGFWVHLTVAFLVLDLLNYGLHRAMHAVPLLWRLHALHHTDLSVDVSTMVRHHPLETIVAAVSMGIAGAVLGCSAIEISAYAVAETLVQTVGHADIRLPRLVEHLLGGVLVTPNFHRIHHSSERVETDSNYGQLFALWDRLFGTSGGYAGEQRGAIAYGLKSFRDERSQRLDQLLLLPAHAIARD